MLYSESRACFTGKVCNYLGFVIIAHVCDGFLRASASEKPFCVCLGEKQGLLVNEGSCK